MDYPDFKNGYIVRWHDDFENISGMWLQLPKAVDQKNTWIDFALYKDYLRVDYDDPSSNIFNRISFINIKIDNTKHTIFPSKSYWDSDNYLTVGEFPRNEHLMNILKSSDSLQFRIYDTNLGWHEGWLPLNQPLLEQFIQEENNQ